MACEDRSLGPEILLLNLGIQWPTVIPREKTHQHGSGKKPSEPAYTNKSNGEKVVWQNI